MKQLLFALGVLGLAAPAQAEVTQASQAGFVSVNVANVKATPAQVWAVLVDPARYWSADHTWSGNSANLTIESRAGGCFCEAIPANGPVPVGSVEHMRVVQALPGRTLRMLGALGPLQSEALDGTLTIALKPIEGGGTQITWEYVVGGYARANLVELSIAVDQVQAQQLSRLAANLPQ